MPWRKVHTLITIFLGTTIPSQFGLINLQISCQIVSKMIGVNIGRAGTKMTRCDKNREGSL